MKVDNLKEMSEKQTADQKASIESLTKLISDTAKNQEASIKASIKASAASLEKQVADSVADQKASAASFEKQVVDSADTLRKQLGTQISEVHAGLSHDGRGARALVPARNERFDIQDSVTDTQTFARSAFASALVPVVLVGGVGGLGVVTGMSTGYIVPAAISLDIAKDLAKTFSGLAFAGFTTAGITFNVYKYFAKADRARLQKDREELYQERKQFYAKQQEAYHKEAEKRAGDK